MARLWKRGCSLVLIAFLGHFGTEAKASRIVVGASSNAPSLASSRETRANWALRVDRAAGAGPARWSVWSPIEEAARAQARCSASGPIVGPLVTDLEGAIDAPSKPKPVPEPASVALFVTSMPLPLVVLGLLRRRRRAAGR